MVPILVNQNVVKFAGKSSTVLFGLTAFLQILIAAGILPVTMAWGGRQLELTLGLRLASLMSAIILIVFAYIFRRRAGLLGEIKETRWIKIITWVITGFLFINTLGNLTSQSLWERIVITPISFFLMVACLIVSFSVPDNLTYKNSK